MNIRFSKSYKSIQAEFEWKDVPDFAIITGVNGVGKTQLLKAIEENNQDVVSITDNLGKAEEIVVCNNNANTTQSVEKLIEYKNTIIARLAKKEEQENLINIYNNSIDNAEKKLQAATNDVERQRCMDGKNKSISKIALYEKEIKKLFEYSYDKELEEISNKLGKESKALTDEEVRSHANPYFNTLTEIEDFENYVKQECEEKKEVLFQLSKKNDNEALINEGKKEYSYHVINHYFKRFGFCYYEMQDPFGVGTEHKGRIWFKGQMGEEVEYNDLSSGEQMIVKFIFWMMGKDFRGNRINTMLLDEPDRSLHPSMCQLMVNILHELSKPKEKGGSGIRIIITTHSPSTVAFAPENNLFVMEKDEHNKRCIRHVSTEEAEDVLSEGILTYRKSIKAITIVSTTSHQNLLFVEGKTDMIHLKKAIEMLKMELDIEILSLHGADCLESFIKITPSEFFNNKKAIALFDCDEKGKKVYVNIKGVEEIPSVKKLTASHCKGVSFALNIQPLDDSLLQYCPIEFLYPKQYLDVNGILVKRNLNEFINRYQTSSNDSNEVRSLTDEFDKGSTLRPFKVSDDAKTRFAENIVNENDPAVFAGFRPTLELIQQIIEYEGHP